METVKSEVGRPYYRARTKPDVLAVLDEESGPEFSDPEPGSNSLRWWRRRESNPRPKARHRRNLHACPLLGFRHRCEEEANNHQWLVSNDLVAPGRHGPERPAR